MDRLLRILFCVLIVAAFACAPGQDAAKALRQKALELRTDATRLRDQAAELRRQADKGRQAAQEARDKAADARKRGDESAASTLEAQARDSANAAATADANADATAQKADRQEELASQKEEEARKIEAAGKSAADQLYRRLRATFALARTEIADLKEYQAATRVGKQSMAVRWARDHIHDEELKPFGEPELNQLFAEYEQEIGKLGATIEVDRDAYAAGKLTSAQYAEEAYSLLANIVRSLVNAEFHLVAKSYDTIEAELYVLERRLHEELASAKEQLRHANISDAAAKAFLDALIARQGEDRHKVFLSVARRYQVEKNRLAIFVQDWVTQVNGWHDFAVKLSTGDDAHRAGAESMETLLRQHFTTGVTLPMSVGMFAFALGSPDRVGTWYGDYPWCKARPFPDIQTDEDDAGMLRMKGILEKLNVLVKSGRVDGAAKTISP